MQFKPTPPTEDAPAAHILSEMGLWHISLHPVMYGVRVQAFRTGDRGTIIDICLGTNPYHIMTGYLALVVIMATEHESISERELRDLIPPYKVRPVPNDEEFWHAFQLQGAKALAHLTPGSWLLGPSFENGPGKWLQTEIDKSLRLLGKHKLDIL